MTKATLTVIVGASCVGKTTLVNLLDDLNPGVARLVTSTSRPIRPGETDGQDYHFLTREQFESGIAAGEFLEHSEYAGNLYGSSRKVLDHMRRAYQAVLAVVDLNGAKAIKEAYPECLTVLLLPSSRQELMDRLGQRKGVDPKEAQRRLDQMDREIAQAAGFAFDRIIVNVNQRLGIAARQLLEAVQPQNDSGQ